MGLTIKPISLANANAYVEEMHRHHPKVQGHKFSIACYDNNRLCGVAIVGRPQGRFLDDGKTLEILRLCTDGTRNACSILYGRCARICKEMGYEKIITFILMSENGSSLKASGFTKEADNVGGLDWSKNNRYRQRHEYEQMSLFPTKQPPKELKQRWSKKLIESEEK